jgi:uncharacterized membrane protein YheB (UPF0754 family)
MEWIQMILDFLQVYVDNFSWSVLLIPVVSAIIGWGTNVLALKMTFYPLEFIGYTYKKIQLLGWQGIIPSKAGDMAGKAVDMITTKLIDIEDQFALINPKVVAKEMEPRMMDLAREIIDESMSQEVPLWKLLGERQKEVIYQRAAIAIPKVTEDIMEDVKNNIGEIFNLKKMAIDHLTQNKNLLNRIFLEVGHKEFKFIEYSGIYFGFIFGIIQALIWIPLRDAGLWWQLPLGGLIVGYLTNILALRMIFTPTEPKYVFGLKIQGLFIKRQKEVSKAYSKIIADNIMTMPNIFDAMMNGPAADRLVAIIKEHVNQSVDDTAGYSSALIRITSGTDSFDRIKKIAMKRFINEVPEHIHLIFDYAKQALDIEHTLHSKMSSLPPDEFVGFLRPVFQEDEWKLILVGAILGMVAGFLQLLITGP